MLIDKNALINNLPSFYGMYGLEDSIMDIEFILDLYEEIISLVIDYIHQVKNNSNMSKMETYRILPFRMVSSTRGLYNLENLLYNENIEDALSIGNTHFEERKNIWRDSPSDRKVELLIESGNYISLEAKGDYMLGTYDIISADVYNLKNESMVRGLDYELYNNKIFFLNIETSSDVYTQRLILKNIIVDYDVPQEYLGKNIGVPYKDAISKPEYRDFLQMLIMASSGGPTLANIKKAFSYLISWDGASIFDMYSAESRMMSFWDEGGILTPFDFMINIPIAFFNSEEKIAIFRDFLNIIKPVYTNYFIAWSQNVIDKIIVNGEFVKNKIVDATQAYTLNVSDYETTKTIQSDSYTIGIQQSEIIRVEWDPGDERVTFDSGFITDLLYQNIVSAGSAGYGDYANTTLTTFPEFPVNFAAKIDVVTGNLTATFKDSAPGVTRYDIYRNSTVINVITANGNGTIVSAIDAGYKQLPAGTYRYFARSVYEYDPLLPEYTKVSIDSKDSIITKK